METGLIEVKATSFETLNSASPSIPFKMREQTGVGFVLFAYII